MQNINQLKAEIISVLELLPAEGVELLAEFVAFLRTKFNINQDTMTPPTRAYGIRKGEFVVPDDFNDPLPDDILDAFNSRSHAPAWERLVPQNTLR